MYAKKKIYTFQFKNNNLPYDVNKNLTGLRKRKL